jgi:hypothetical protein
MVFAMRDRHDKRHKSEYQQYDTDDGNVLHIEAPHRQRMLVLTESVIPASARSLT